MDLLSACSLSFPALSNSDADAMVVITIITVITEPLNLAYHLYGNLNMMCHSLIGYPGGFVYV